MNWHRLFGLMMMDLFWGTPFEVELEQDLSLHRQLLDVLVVRRIAGQFPGKPPDGLDDLAEHNLFTYKSLHEALDDWVLKELTGHYVNYRKHVSGKLPQYAPESCFRLFAISTRFPEKLSKEISLAKIEEGIFEARRGTDAIRLIVLNEISNEPHNALWQLFSAHANKIELGAARYRFRKTDASTALNTLFKLYRNEGLVMSYTLEQFYNEFMLEHLHELKPEEVIKAVSLEDLLKAVPTEDLLKAVPTEDLLKAVPTEDLLKGRSEAELKDLYRILASRLNEAPDPPATK